MPVDTDDQAVVLEPLMAPATEAMGSVSTPAWRLKGESRGRTKSGKMTEKSGLGCGPGRNAMRVVETRAVKVQLPKVGRSLRDNRLCDAGIRNCFDPIALGSASLDFRQGSWYSGCLRE